MNVKNKIQQLLANKESTQKELLLEEIVLIRKYLDTIVPDNTVKNNSGIYKPVLNQTKGTFPLPLTKRQQHIFQLIGLGLQSKEIAQELNLSLNTVTTHRKNIIKRLELRGAGQLQRFAQKHLLSDKDPKNTL